MQIDPLIAAESIQARVRELAEQLKHEEMTQQPLCLIVLHGGLPFARDLARAMGTEETFETVEISSYLGESSAQQEPQIIGKLPDRIRDRRVLVIDDILDTGRTLDLLHRELLKEGADMVKFCVLLRKNISRVCDVEADYVGFDIENEFVVGYGLDYNNEFRELPYIGVLRLEELDSETA